MKTLFGVSLAAICSTPLVAQAACYHMGTYFECDGAASQQRVRNSADIRTPDAEQSQTNVNVDVSVLALQGVLVPGLGNPDYANRFEPGQSWQITRIGNSLIGTDGHGTTFNQPWPGSNIYGTDGNGHGFTCFRVSGHLECN